MEFISFHVSVFDSLEFVGCSGEQQATWLKLQRYCAGQENGGRIAGCRQWNDRLWLSLCRVKPRAVAKDSPLWQWDGDDLVVAYYPTGQQDRVQRLRNGATRAARIRWNKGAENAARHADGIADADASGSAVVDARRGEERRGVRGDTPLTPQGGSVKREQERTLPEALAAEPAFVAAWEDWCAYRVALNNGKMLPHQTWDSHLELCLRLGPTEGSAALRRAIELGLRAPVELGEKSRGTGAAAASVFNPSVQNAHTGGVEGAN